MGVILQVELRLHFPNPNPNYPRLQRQLLIDTSLFGSSVKQFLSLGSSLPHNENVMYIRC